MDSVIEKATLLKTLQFKRAKTKLGHFNNEKG